MSGVNYDRNPETCRATVFTQTDPMPMSGGSFEASYVYGRNNPTIYVDPSGLRASCNTSVGRQLGAFWLNTMWSPFHSMSGCEAVATNKILTPVQVAGATAAGTSCALVSGPYGPQAFGICAGGANQFMSNSRSGAGLFTGLKDAAAEGAAAGEAIGPALINQGPINIRGPRGPAGPTNTIPVSRSASESAGGAATGSAVRPVGGLLESVDDVLTNPSLLAGKSPAQVRTILQGSEGWVEGTMNQGRSAGSGWTFRQMNSSGSDYTGRYIQWSPRSVRKFDGGAYWKVSVGGNVKTVRVPQ
jgi:hypothetical protein